MSELQRLLLEAINAQLSIYTGKKDAGLAELQRLVHKLEQGQKIVCECCQLDHAGLLPVHKEDCKIVKHYEKVWKGKL